MHSTFKLLPARELLTVEAPSLVAALVIAELFYKFHSFLLEAVAFLVTWYLIGLGIDWVRRTVGKRTG